MTQIQGRRLVGVNELTTSFDELVLLLTDDHLRFCIQALVVRIDPFAVLVLYFLLFVILDMINTQGSVKDLSSIEVVDG